MPRTYTQLNVEQRITLYQLLYEGQSFVTIAQAIGCHRSTIYRECARNSGQYGYRPDWAAQQALQRRHKHARLAKNVELRNRVIEKLALGWSPESIAGHLQREQGRTIINKESIYRYIYSKEGQRLKLYRHLRKQRKFRFPRVKRKRQRVYQETKTSIHARDEAINQRQTVGHWEGDLIVFQKQPINVITLRERKSRYVGAIKNNSRHSQSTLNTLINYMKTKSNLPMKSITLDNDTSFTYFNQIKTHLAAQVYFCDPYKSYQKGAIENANKLLRNWLPKQADISKWQQADLDQITDQINDRPMRCLDYQTPREVLLRQKNQSLS